MISERSEENMKVLPKSEQRRRYKAISDDLQILFALTFVKAKAAPGKGEPVTQYSLSLPNLAKNRLKLSLSEPCQS
jgi:hypothetical protein